MKRIGTLSIPDNEMEGNELFYQLLEAFQLKQTPSAEGNFNLLLQYLLEYNSKSTWMIGLETVTVSYKRDRRPCFWDFPILPRKGEYLFKLRGHAVVELYNWPWLNGSNYQACLRIHSGLTGLQRVYEKEHSTGEVRHYYSFKEFPLLKIVETIRYIGDKEERPIIMHCGEQSFDLTGMTEREFIALLDREQLLAVNSIIQI